MFSERVQSSDAVRRRSRAGQRDATHARILQAAGALFDSQGYEETTIRAIAKEAGVSTGRVITVGDKERLLVLTVEERLWTVHDLRAHCTAGGGTGAPAGVEGVEEAIARLIRPFVEIYVASPGLSREYAAILARGRTESSVFDDLAARLEGEIAEVLEAGSGTDHAAAARTIYLVFIGALYAAAHGTLPFGRIATDVRSAVRVIQGSRGPVVPERAQGSVEGDAGSAGVIATGDIAAGDVEAGGIADEEEPS